MYSDLVDNAVLYANKKEKTKNFFLYIYIYHKKHLGSST